MYKRKRAGNTITRKINSTKDTAAKADKNHYISNSYLEGFIPIDTEYFTASIKTEFEAHPVYVRRDDRIKAHFMTCYISLLIYRLLEKKLEDNYTSHQIIETLRSMQLTLLSTANGYIPS